MKVLNFLVMVSLCAVIAACSGGGGGSSSSSDSGGASSGGDSGGSSDGGSDGGGSSAVVVGLEMPDQVDVVTATEESSVNAQLRALDFITVLRAFNDAGTDYVTDEQFIHTWHPGLEPIDTVNSILCFIAQVKGDEMVGEGAYIALIDDSDCNTGDSSGSSSGSSGDQSSAADNSVSFIEVVAIATRTDNDSDMIVNAWIPEMGGGEGGPESIKLHIVVSESPSDANPNGSFHMSFGFFDSADEANADARTGGGELATATSPDGRSGFTLYETSEDSFGDLGSGTFTQLASVFVDEGTDSGDAVTSMSFAFTEGSNPGNFGGGDDFSSFGLSFDGDEVLIAEVSDLSDLFDGSASADLCLSRTSYRQAVWRYDLYWGDDGVGHDAGDRVELNSGFPFRFDSDGDDEPDSFGFVGYWGVWADGDQVLADGTEIERDTFGGPGGGGAGGEQGGEETAPEVYTVQTSGGRLIKNSVETLAVTELEGVQFYYWDDSLFDPNSAVSYDQWVVEYLASTDSRAVGGAGWYKVGGISFGGRGGGGPGDCESDPCSENSENSEIVAMVDDSGDEGSNDSDQDFGGPQIETLETAVKVTFNFEGERLFMFSDQLGGGVEFQQGATEITFFREEFVDGTQDEFAGGTGLSLVCYEQCPIGTLSLDDLSTFDGPYVGFNHNEIFKGDGHVACNPDDEECAGDFACEGEDCPDAPTGDGGSNQIVAALDDGPNDCTGEDCPDRFDIGDCPGDEPFDEGQSSEQAGDGGSDSNSDSGGADAGGAGGVGDGEEVPCAGDRFSSEFIDLINVDFEIVTYGYSFGLTGDNALTLVRTENNQPVVIESGVTRDQLMQTPHSWGLHSGRMITTDTADRLQFTFPWEIYNSSLVTVFYTWETGLEQWNRLTVVRNSAGEIAQFDKPVDFVYEHTNANDRSPVGSGETNAFEGQTFMFNYGGRGDFWGIPFANVGDGRWYPLFNIADGVAMGPMDEYVIKAREIEQKMEQLENACTNLTLDNLVQPPTDFTASYDVDIGAMPTVDGSPSVVGGVVQTSSSE